MESDIWLNYSDVTLLPSYSTLNSRQEAIVSVPLGGNRKFRVPLIPSNMKCVIDSEIAKWLSNNDYFYVMHRFQHDNYDFVKTANREKWKTVSISIGVQKVDLDLIKKFAAEECRVHYVTIDVAHGHHSMVKDACAHVRAYLPETILIAGNVGTAAGAFDLTDWGADAIKVGIGGGTPCTTRDKTGFYTPMFTLVKNIRRELDRRFYEKEIDRPYIIADGGVRSVGDVAKALVAGADMVMAGGVFAALKDSPADTIKGTSGARKQYYGSASFENKGHRNNIEGTSVSLESSNRTYAEYLEEVAQDLQSSCSYAGVRNISELTKVVWVQKR